LLGSKRIYRHQPARKYRRRTTTNSANGPPPDETFTEYTVDGEVFHEVDRLEAALRGEIDA
jgi:hypothetical protein